MDVFSTSSLVWTYYRSSSHTIAEVYNELLSSLATLWLTSHCLAVFSLSTGSGVKSTTVCDVKAQIYS